MKHNVFLDVAVWSDSNLKFPNVGLYLRTMSYRDHVNLKLMTLYVHEG